MAELEPYRIPAKPVIYKGVQMKSTLEARTAQALERIGLEFKTDFVYEPDRYGASHGFYTPDFCINGCGVSEGLAVEGRPGFTRDKVFVETQYSMQEPALRQKAEWYAATLAVSTDSPLVFVGLNEFPVALLGWCFGIEPSPVLAAIGQRRSLEIDGNHGLPEPCLYVGTAANIWIDGFWTASLIEGR